MNDDTKITIRAIACIHCGQTVIVGSDETAAIKNMAEHDSTCEKHPLQDKIRALTADMDILRDDLQSANETIIELKDNCRCPDCGCATIADAESSECGCDAPVCLIEAGDTLAKAYVRTRAALESIEKAAGEYLSSVGNYIRERNRQDGDSTLRSHIRKSKAIEQMYRDKKALAALLAEKKVEKRTIENWGDTCGPDCQMCTGEYCSLHITEPCTCDVLTRHGIALPEKGES